MRRTSLQTGSRINWKDAALTRGLRHVIVPAISGIGGSANVIPDLVDPNCYLGMTGSGEATHLSNDKQKPDTNAYTNIYADVFWYLYGDSLQFYADKDWSILVRAHPIATDGRTMWGTGHGPTYGKGWEMIQYPSGIFGQFGIWVGGYIDNFNTTVNPPTGNVDTVNPKYTSAIFSWDGSTHSFFVMSENTYQPPRVFAGASVWSGGIGGQATGWGMTATDGIHASYLTHMYMWESALTPQAAAQLIYNPGAIFARERSYFIVKAGAIPVPLSNVPGSPVVGGIKAVATGTVIAGQVASVAGTPAIGGIAAAPSGAAVRGVALVSSPALVRGIGTTAVGAGSSQVARVSGVAYVGGIGADKLTQGFHDSLASVLYPAALDRERQVLFGKGATATFYAVTRTGETELIELKEGWSARRIPTIESGANEQWRLEITSMDVTWAMVQTIGTVRLFAPTTGESQHYRVVQVENAMKPGHVYALRCEAIDQT